MSEIATDGTIPQWNLADRLRKSLEHAGVEADIMAQYLEVHPNTIRNWTTGRTRPRSSDLRLWAMRTGVPYSWLIGADQLPRVGSNHQPAGRLNDLEMAAAKKDLRGLIRRGTFDQLAGLGSSELSVYESR